MPPKEYKVHSMAKPPRYVRRPMRMRLTVLTAVTTLAAKKGGTVDAYVEALIEADLEKQGVTGWERSIPPETVPTLDAS